MNMLINPKHSSSDSDSNSNDDANNNANLWLLLPEELMFYIFTLVPPHYLFNSARYVCKPWDAAIASSYFAKLCEHFSKPGLYIENCKSHGSSYFLEFKDDVNGQFERTDLGTPQKMGYTIGTCDGILLLSNKARDIVVVNPILKCWLSIPRLRHYPLAVGCQYTITRVPHTATFKLFFAHVLEVSGVSLYVFYVLRIGIDKKWKKILKKEAPLHRYFSGKPLYSGGNDLYWITNEEVIVMDVVKETVEREYPLPPRMRSDFGPFEILLWMGGRLSCTAYNSFSGTYQIYILDFDSREWSRAHEIPFGYFKAACGHNLEPTNVVVRLLVNNQIIFRVNLPQNQIGKKIPGYIYMHFSYNVKTEQLTKIEDIEVGDFQVWLHTHNLASLPTTLA